MFKKLPFPLTLQDEQKATEFCTAIQILKQFQFHKIYSLKQQKLEAKPISPTTVEDSHTQCTGMVGLLFP